MLISSINHFNVFRFGLTGVFLFLDGIIYWAVSKLFALFEALAKVQILTEADYNQIVEKFYVIIGIVMLFYLTYSLLKSLINPDELGKTTSKIAVNLITSLILLGIVPYIFSYAFKLQNAIVDEDIIAKLILGAPDTNADHTIAKRGVKSAFITLNAFLNPNNANIIGESGDSWSAFTDNILNNNASFMDITDFVEPIHDNSMEYQVKPIHDNSMEYQADEMKKVTATYTPIISSICGCFLVYVLVSFSLDLGVRVIKLAFYQIIAPIPILMRIIPEKKSVFDNWIKACISTFMELFIRYFVMYIVVYLAAVILEGGSLGIGNELDLLGKVVVYLGLFAFAKQAPKLIGDVMGIDAGGIKLGIGGKLAAAGALGIGAMAGGFATTGIRNFAKGINNAENKWKDVGNYTGINKAKAIGKSLWSSTIGIAGSTITGATSGGIRSAKAGFSAKNFSDVRKAAGAGAKGATNARDRREAYRVAHGGVVGAMTGHYNDMIANAQEWVGGGFEAEEKKIKYYNDVLASRDKSKAEAEKLRDKNANDTRLMEKVGARIEWKGSTQAQKDEYKRIFDSMVTIDGNGNSHQMSLEAIRSHVDSLSKQDTSGMTEDKLKEYNVMVANYKNMLNQVEKASWQAMESAAFDTTLMADLGLDANKVSGIRKELDDLNNRRKAVGDAALNPTDYKAFDDTMTALENTRNQASAELEKKKRAREDRNQGKDK